MSIGTTTRGLARTLGRAVKAGALSLEELSAIADTLEDVPMMMCTDRYASDFGRSGPDVDARLVQDLVDEIGEVLGK